MEFLDRFRTVFLAGLAIVVIGLAATIATFSINTTTTELSFESQTLNEDTQVSVLNQRIFISSATTTASASTIEAIPAAYSSANTAINNGYIVYELTLQETGGGDWTAGRTYDVEVVGDGALLGSFVVENTVADGAVEGAVLQLGLTCGACQTQSPDNFTVSVERQ